MSLRLVETFEAYEVASTLDAMEAQEARAALARCCGSRRWVEAMLAARPFVLDERLYATARRLFHRLDREDQREAFRANARIGEDPGTLLREFPATAALASAEQARVVSANALQLVALREQNLAYEARFGRVFVVSAQGKGAGEILALLDARMFNDEDEELALAAEEQTKITRLRLAKLAG